MELIGQQSSNVSLNLKINVIADLPILGVAIAVDKSRYPEQRWRLYFSKYGNNSTTKENGQ